MIKTKGLSKSYIKKEVLNGINFEANAVEIVGFFEDCQGILICGMQYLLVKNRRK